MLLQQQRQGAFTQTASLAYYMSCTTRYILLIKFKNTTISILVCGSASRTNPVPIRDQLCLQFASLSSGDDATGRHGVGRDCSTTSIRGSPIIQLATHRVATKRSLIHMHPTPRLTGSGRIQNLATNTYNPVPFYTFSFRTMQKIML
jgi:hypothetical protein